LQYFLRTSDEHAEHYLKLFTLLPIQRIKEILREHVKGPEMRTAQRILAENVVALVHSADVAQRCIFQTAALYPAASGDYKSETILQAFHGDSTMVKKFTHDSVLDVPLSQLLKMIGLVKSHSPFPSH
jgi:tyrosyl-tRNA synthetase